MFDIIASNFGSYNCVASGPISQADGRFQRRSSNTQCVCISVTASACIENLNRDFFTSQIIDKLIIEVDIYYNETKRLLGDNHNHSCLNPDEVVPNLNYLVVFIK